MGTVGGVGTGGGGGGVTGFDLGFDFGFLACVGAGLVEWCAGGVRVWRVGTKWTVATGAAGGSACG